MHRIGISTAILFLFCTGTVFADNLFFPKTELEIIKALSKQDAKTITASDGTKYLAENGKVYKMIGGRRFRLRGVQIVDAIAVLPKAGALINFGFDSEIISKESFPLLDEFGKALKGGLSDSVIMVAGHTDSDGSEVYNQKLSEKRAKSVAAYLRDAHGISSDRLLIKGFGEKQPVVDNDTEENRFKNRRVEFVRIE